MKNVKNNFFKWLYYFSKQERNDLNYDFKDAKATHALMLKNSFNKFRSWKKNGMYSEGDFDRHRKKVETSIYKLEDITSIIHECKLKLEAFLIKNEAKQDNLLQHQILFKSAKRRNFTEAYFYHLHKREEINKESTTISFNHWQEVFDINYNRYFHPNFEKDKAKIEINGINYAPKEVIEESWIALQKFSLTAQMRMICELKTRESIYGDKFINFSEDIVLNIITQIHQFSFEELPTAHIYAEMYNWMGKKVIDEIDSFLKFKIRLLKNIHFFPNNEQVALFIFMLNEGAKLEQEGNIIGQELYYELSKYGLENHILGDKIPIEGSLFMNIYDMTYNRYPDFASALLKDYSSKMVKTDEIWINDFLETRRLFHQKKFINAFKVVQSLNNHRNFGLTIRKYVLMLQCQYEVRKNQDDGVLIINKEIMNKITDDDVIYGTINAFSQAITATQYFEQPSDAFKNAALVFIHIFQELFQKTNSISEIKNQLLPLKCYAKQWLLEKLDELK